MQPTKIYSIENEKILGEFLLHYGPTIRTKKLSALRPCFNGHMAPLNSFVLVAGYLSIENQFYPCPISCYYIQINDIIKLKSEIEEWLKINLIVFSKNFEKHKMVEIKVQSHLNDDILSIAKYINQINYYIFLDNDIDGLKKYIDKTSIQGINSYGLMKSINNLLIECFDNSNSRVGKDNQFWSEAKISNLPTNVYLRQIINKCLELESTFENVSLYGDSIFIRYGSHNAYSPHHGSVPVDDPETKLLIKDTIKSHVLALFDLNSYINENLKLPL